MALSDIGNYGRGGGDNNPNRVYDPTCYSRIKIKNNDKLVTTFSFYKGLLHIEVAKESDGYRYDTVNFINLSPVKAKILIGYIEKFIEDMKSGNIDDADKGWGVSAGIKELKVIAFKITGNKLDVPEHSFTLCTVAEDGSTSDAVEFVFNTDYDYGLIFDNVYNMNVTKDVHNFMGINTFLDVLKEYVSSASGAIGASVWDTGRYEVNRVIKRIDPIWDKLGIERKNPNVNSFNTNSRGVGNGMNPPTSDRTSTHKSYEDIEDMLS